MATAMDTATPPVHDLEYALVEAWLDEHPDFVDDYFLRKATKELVDLWMLLHMTPSSVEEFKAQIINEIRNASYTRQEKEFFTEYLQFCKIVLLNENLFP